MRRILIVDVSGKCRKSIQYDIGNDLLKNIYHHSTFAKNGIKCNETLKGTISFFYTIVTRQGHFGL